MTEPPRDFPSARREALSWTQLCVLRVVTEHGGSHRWSEIADEIRRRSGRTVRANANTLFALRKRGLISLDGAFVRLTDAGAARFAPLARESSNG
jgi:DNA-binding MarR family transcriptional regulator